MLLKTQLISTFIGIISFFLFATPAFAHVIVYPHQVGIAATQVFDMSVPTEKNNPTVAIKLLIPSVMQAVVPSVKAGWTIKLKKNGNTVTEIDWTNGSIPPEERDDFYFSAQVPPTETTLKWKAYQTYQDGSVAAWDHNPTSNPMDDSAPPPYSTTKVINDLTGINTQQPTMMQANQSAVWAGVGLSILLSLAAIGISLRKKY